MMGVYGRMVVHLVNFKVIWPAKINLHLLHTSCTGPEDGGKGRSISLTETQIHLRPSD